MWHFREMGRAEINQDPTADYFFNVEALENLSDALVRESIQNSLDAKASGSSLPVTVRITIPKPDFSLDPSATSPFLNGLWQHLQAIPDLEQLPSSKDRVSWILVEDFGTRGLEGDVEASEDPSDDRRNDFYYFWRNVGRGRKTGDDRGRWGLGKTMFPASSRINSFFGYSVRASDGAPLLMGQSVLRIHKIGERKHYPFGYFGRSDSDCFVTPISDAEVISSFKSTFYVSRENEPGLSVVIPYPHDGFGITDITHSVIHHYFFPILNGELEVEISDGDKITKIDPNNIDTIISGVEGAENSIAPFLDLTRTYLSLPDHQMYTTSSVNAGRAPTWTEERLTPEKLDAALEELDSFHPVCFRCPVYVYRIGKQPLASHFDVLLQRYADLEKPEDIFVRQGITISGERSLREPGVRALVIAADSAVASFLGDAENPAHTEWQEKSKKFKGKYNAGSSTLRFIKSAPQGLMNILNRRSDKIDDTILRHIFPGPSGDGSASSEPVERTGNPTRSARPTIQTPRRPPFYSLNKTTDGFSIKLTDDALTSLPIQFVVRCAYDVARGNPFTRWAPEDFIFFSEPVSATVQGGAVVEHSENKCTVLAESSEFHASFRGFDPERDVIVDVRIEVGTHA